DLLLSGKQIAFGGIGKELQGVGAHPLLLPRQSCGDPAWQLVTLEWIDGDGHAGALESREPGRGLCRTIEPRQRDERHRVGIRIGGAVLEHSRALSARLATGNAQIDEFATAEKTQVAIGT